MSIVLLEHLPASFSEATLNSIIGHVPCKGKILSTNLVPDGENLAAHVHFERAEDADAAVRLWDQLTIDNAVITASSEADTKRRLSRNVTAQHSNGLRYPFAPMNIGWLYEFVNSHKNPQKGYIMCHILECLMCNAVTTSDPFMEHAVVHFYTKFTCTAWTRAQGQMQDGVSFELCRQVFEVIGLIRRYPSANTKSRKMLLTLVERVVDDISKVSITSKADAVNKAIPEVITSVRSSIAALRSLKTAEAGTQHNCDSEASLANLMSWLKFLFTCLSSHHSHVSGHPDAATIVPCSDSCACFARLKSSYPVLVADVEKVKVIDALVVMAGRDTADTIAGIARDLLQHYNIDFCCRAVAHIHNGKFAILRLYAFDALRFAKRLQQPASAPVNKALDLIEIALLTAQETCRDYPALNAVSSNAMEGLRMLSVLRVAVEKGGDEPVQQYYTLYYALQQMFTALCTPNLFLCVHEADQPDAGTGGTSIAPSTLTTKETLIAKIHSQQEANAAAVAAVTQDSLSTMPAAEKQGSIKDKCGNPECTVSGDGLLKCSACKSVYYCSEKCQKQDWKAHKNVCRTAATVTARTRMDAAAAVKEQAPSAPVPMAWPAVSGGLSTPLPPPLPTAHFAANERNIRRITSVLIAPSTNVLSQLALAVGH
jgi:hypothetical protein